MVITDNMEGLRVLSKRRKMKKICSSKMNGKTNNINEIQLWKSKNRQELYSLKLVQALRQVRVMSYGTARGRAVREAADRVLAMTAKGRSRWSRAILTNKSKLKLKKSNLRQRGITATGIRLKNPRVGILRLNLPTMQRKASTLGRLVPGCQKQPLPVVLEEAIDYIAALEMQVKAMAALANLPSGGFTSGAGPVNLSQLGNSQPSPSS